MKLRQVTTFGLMLWCMSITSCGGGGGGGGTDTNETVTPPPVNPSILGDPVTILDGESDQILMYGLDGINAIYVRIDDEPAIYQYQDTGFVRVEFHRDVREPNSLNRYDTIHFHDLDSNGYEDLIFTDNWLVKAMSYNGVTWAGPYLIHDFESVPSLCCLESITYIGFRDMDNDGDMDYQFGVVAEPGRYSDYWCENLGPAMACSSKIDLDILTSVVDESGDHRNTKYFVDLNNDGILDVVHHSYYLYYQDFYIRAFFSTAPWEYPIESTLETEDASYSTQFRFADLNNDGLVDLSLMRNPAEPSEEPAIPIVYFNSGGNAFLPPETMEGLPEIDSSSGDSKTRTWDAEHDFNLDGAIDYIYFESDQLILVSGHSQSQGGFARRIVYELPASLPDDWNSSVRLIDLDDDGDQDLVYQAGSGSIGYMMNLTI
jgi:hypothetical protein